MMTSNDAVVLQQFCVMMRFNAALQFCPPKMMDTVNGSFPRPSIEGLALQNNSPPPPPPPPPPPQEIC